MTLREEIIGLIRRLLAGKDGLREQEAFLKPERLKLILGEFKHNDALMDQNDKLYSELAQTARRERETCYAQMLDYFDRYPDATPEQIIAYMRRDTLDHLITMKPQALHEEL